MLRDPVGLKVENRLAVQDEQVILEGLADALRPGLPGGHPLPLLGAGERQPVAALLLGVVHRDVGIDQQVLRRGLAAGVEERRADARCEARRALSATRDALPAHRVEQRPREGLGVTGGRVW